MTYRVVWTGTATKQLLAIPKKQRLMIAKWVQENLDGCADPKAVPGAKRLKGTAAGWRWRVGSYRILGSVHKGELLVEVVRVSHRQGAYGNFSGLDL